METTRLTVVSNRLAIVVDRDESGQYTIKPGSGGLVTALGPVLRDRGGQWIGWLGSSLQDVLDKEALNELLGRGSRVTGYDLVPVELSEEEIEKYYSVSPTRSSGRCSTTALGCNFDPATGR